MPPQSDVSPAPLPTAETHHNAVRSRRMSGVDPLDIIAVADSADALGPDVLRMENLDTDLPPPATALRATQRALDALLPDASSYLPFTGKADLRAAISDRLLTQSGRAYDSASQVVVASGGLATLFAALLATVDHGDAVVLTDPCYAGFIARVRLAGALPVHVPLRAETGRWRLDTDALDRVQDAKAIITMSPSMPTGHIMNESEWQAVERLVERTGAWVLHDAAMERLTFDGQPLSTPLTRPALAARTIVIGSAAKEYRMIGWRIGWAAGPTDIMRDVGSAVVYSTVVPSGFAQAGVAAAMRDPDDGVARATATWQARRDALLAQLDGLPVIRPDGGWSLLVDAHAVGTTARLLSRTLLEHGRIAATPMTAWGSQVAPNHVRLVYAREPVERLHDVRRRFDHALHES